MEDPEHLEPEEDDEEEDETGPLVTVEIVGLSLYTHHGVGEAEREVGQRLDYADVCEQVAFAAQERSYRTLERLCSAVADRMIDRYGAESVTVRATKPEPPIPLPVEEVSVEIWKENR
jgi:dihydroneopterin aldolase